MNDNLFSFYHKFTIHFLKTFTLCWTLVQSKLIFLCPVVSRVKSIISVGVTSNSFVRCIALLCADYIYSLVAIDIPIFTNGLLTFYCFCVTYINICITRPLPLNFNQIPLFENNGNTNRIVVVRVECWFFILIESQIHNVYYSFFNVYHQFNYSFITLSIQCICSCVCSYHYY